MVALGQYLRGLGLCGNFLVHYLKGEGAPKTLPVEAVNLTKQPLIEAFSLHIEGKKKYKSCVARCGGTEDYEWFEGLAGVIGEFRWKPEFVKEGVWFHCWDRFDFNDTCSSELVLPIPKWVADGIIKLALKKGLITEMDLLMQAIFWSEQTSALWVNETLMVKLMKKGFGKPFLTTWSIFIPNEELPPYNPELLEVGTNGEYLCPNYARIKYREKYREEKEQWWQEESKEVDTSWWDS